MKYQITNIRKKTVQRVGEFLQSACISSILFVEISTVRTDCNYITLRVYVDP